MGPPLKNRLQTAGCRLQTGFGQPATELCRSYAKGSLWNSV